MAQDNQTNGADEANDNKQLLPSFVVKGVQWVDFYAPTAVRAFRSFAGIIPVVGKSVQALYMPSDVVKLVETIENTVRAATSENEQSLLQVGNGFALIREALEQNPKWLEEKFKWPEKGMTKRPFIEILLARLGGVIGGGVGNSNMPVRLPVGARVQLANLLGTVRRLAFLKKKEVYSVLQMLDGQRSADEAPYSSAAYVEFLRNRDFPPNLLDESIIKPHAEYASPNGADQILSTALLTQALAQAIEVTAALPGGMDARTEGFLAFEYLQAAIQRRDYRRMPTDDYPNPTVFKNIPLTKYHIEAYAHAATNFHVMGSLKSDHTRLIPECSALNVVDDLIGLAENHQRDRAGIADAAKYGIIEITRHCPEIACKIIELLYEKIQGYYFGVRYDAEELPFETANNALWATRHLMSVAHGVFETSAATHYRFKTGALYAGILLNTQGAFAKELAGLEAFQILQQSTEGEAIEWSKQDLDGFNVGEGLLKLDALSQVGALLEHERNLNQQAIDSLIELIRSPDVNSMEGSSDVFERLQEIELTTPPSTDSLKLFHGILASRLPTDSLLSWYQERFRQMAEGGEKVGAYAYLMKEGDLTNPVTENDEMLKVLGETFLRQPRQLCRLKEVLNIHLSGLQGLVSEKTLVDRSVEDFCLLLTGMNLTAESDVTKAFMADAMCAVADCCKDKDLGVEGVDSLYYMVNTYLDTAKKCVPLGITGDTSLDHAARNFPKMIAGFGANDTKSIRYSLEPNIKKYARLVKHQPKDRELRKYVLAGLIQLLEDERCPELVLTELDRLGKNFASDRDIRIDIMKAIRNRNRHENCTSPEKKIINKTLERFVPYLKREQQILRGDFRSSR